MIERTKKEQSILTDNPQNTSSTSSQNHISKINLHKKRKLIEKELKDLMSKVDEYQLEKVKVSRNQGEGALRKKVTSRNNSEKEMFDQSQIEKRRPITKQLLKEQRYKTRTPRNPNSNSNQRSISSKSKELTGNDKTHLRSSQQKQRYINYLPEIDFRVPLPNKGGKDQRKKQQLINYLEKAQQYQKDAIKKIGQLKKQKGNLDYLQYIEYESRVDNIYVNSLKARIECAMKM